MSIVKVLVPEKEWLLKDNNEKIGSVSKIRKGYIFLHKGHQLHFKNLEEIKSQFGITFWEEGLKSSKKIAQDSENYSIYNYPCSTEPLEPVYNVKRKLPLFSKSLKSKSQYCAGYYIIRFKKNWAKSFCPKLITLERYPYHGPFKTEAEMKILLNKVNKL
jgi:hypothetical protein